MAKHMEDKHKDIPTGERRFKATIINRHHKTINRFVDEAIRLEQTPNLCNSKGEWGCGGLIRLQPKRHETVINFRDQNTTTGGGDFTTSTQSTITLDTTQNTTTTNDSQGGRSLRTKRRLTNQENG